MSQSISQLRRKLIKPTLPTQFSKLAEKSEESSEWLFGDSVSESIENIEKENKLKSLLKAQKIHQTPGPLPSPRRELQNMGRTSDVFNPGHKK